ncbi:MAG: hypothetical protein RLY16_2702 [Bacteroidota bacterium]|jgi:hypothetical protein
MHSFTQEDLLQYMYGESSPEKSAAIDAALHNNWQLQEEYQQLLASKGQLDTVTYHAPRQQSLDFILQYAQSASRKQTVTV